MAEGNRVEPVPMTPEERTHAELVASRSELSTALTRQVEFVVTHLKMKAEDAAAHVSGYSLSGIDREPNHVTWFELGQLMEREPEQGEALWRAIKEHARKELATGVRTARTIEPKAAGHPLDRARFVVVLSGFMKSLEPRNQIEETLVQQMAAAYESYLYWQERASLRAQEEVWQGDRDRRNTEANMSPRARERYGDDHGWMPPRVSQADAIDQAVMIADRYQRSFLRLLKAFRDMRRVIGTVVMTGGQLNVAEQQIVAGDGSSSHAVRGGAASTERSRPVRRPRSVPKHRGAKRNTSTEP